MLSKDFRWKLRDVLTNLFGCLISGEECYEFGPGAVVLQHQGFLLLGDFAALGLGLGQVSLGLDELQLQVEDLLRGRRFCGAQRRFHLESQYVTQLAALTCHAAITLTCLHLSEPQFLYDFHVSVALLLVAVELLLDL